MSRNILLTIAGLSILTGIYILFFPQAFYDAIPGLSMMGPFSIHFIRDVGLAYLASGSAMAWGAWHRQRAVALAGVSWTFLHALFHIQIWAVRGFPFDHIAATDFVAVVLPATVSLWAAWQLPTNAQRESRSPSL